MRELRWRLVSILAFGYSIAGLALAAFAASEANAYLLMLALLGFPIMGLLVLVQRPGNRIGRLLMVPTVLVTTAEILEWAAIAEGIPVEARVWMELSASLFWYGLLGSIALILILFPSGSPVTRADRAALIALMTALAFVIPMELVGSGPLDLTGEPNPLEVPGLAGLSDWAVNGDGFLMYLVVIALAIAGVVLRWRRSYGMERRQFQWFGFGAVLMFIGFAASNALPPGLASDLGFVTALVVMPIAIGLAILRYRLYDIDRVISRTLGYSLVIVALGLLYVVGAVWLPTRLLDEQPPFFVAGSTLAVAALFNPVRKRVLGWVDRRFYRSRYDAERVIENFGRRLRNEVDVNRLTDDWAAVVTETMQPSSVGVWVRER